MTTDWEDRYLRGDMRWEKGAPAPPLVEFLARRRVAGEVLVPGCGTGHDVRAFAAQGAAATGMDIAPSAIRLASAFPRVRGEQYLLDDFLNLPKHLAGRFDWLFEHTLFCAIEPDRRGDYVAASAAALKPGGLLLAIFYLDPKDPEPGEPPYPVSTSELDALFGRHFELIEDWTPATAHPGREGRERMRLLMNKPA